MSTITIPTVTVEVPPACFGEFTTEADGPTGTVVKRTSKKVTVEFDRSSFDALLAFAKAGTGPSHRATVAALSAVKRPSAPKAPKPAPAPESDAWTAERIEALPKAERMALAKAEFEATKAWKAEGSIGEPPARPILDWMESPFKAEAPKRERRVQTTDEDLRTAIVAKLDAGMKGRDAISQALRAEGVPVGEARFRAVWRALRAEQAAA